MKFVIEIKELDSAPKEWTVRSNWPSTGLYKVKNESYSLYQVLETGVGYISYPEMFMTTPYVEAGESVSEGLLLKAIAAASHASVLKGAV